MDKYIISDTSCLILFDKIGELDLLSKVYLEIIVTPEVLQEYKKPTPEWIKVIAVKNKSKQKELEKQLDFGEASAIALALEFSDSVLIIDDKRGRNVAKLLKIRITGTIGTLLKAKRMGIINEIKPYLEKLAKIDYRISKEIEKAVIKEAGE